MRSRNKECNFATDTNKVNILNNVSKTKSDRKNNFWKGAFFDFHHHIPWFFFKIAYAMIPNATSRQLENFENIENFVNLNLSKIEIRTRERNFCHGYQQSEPIKKCFLKRIGSTKWFLKRCILWFPASHLTSSPKIRSFDLQ